MLFTKDIVLVTGSSRGIGKAIAKSFAIQGATVILNGSKDLNALINTHNEFLEEGFKASYFLGDVSEFEVASSLFDMVVKTYGRYPTILINNAGISHVGLFTDTTPAIWQHIIHSNLNSAYNCSYLAIPHMINSRQGCIINISSIWGLCGASCEVAYSTSKSALNGFTQALAKEMGPSQVRVNAIACGWIDTAMNAHFSKEEKEAFIDEVPLCRTGTCEDVAQTCLYLASPASSYMTGQVLSLDGGML